MKALTQDRPGVVNQSRSLRRHPVWWSGAAAAVLWAGTAVLTFAVPDADDLGRTDLLARSSWCWP